VKRLAYVLATWLGCGLSPVAPGTCGTLGALPLYFMLRGLGPSAILAAAVVVALVGTWAADVVARDRGAHDPQLVVIDEAAGVLLALGAAWPASLGGVALVVVLFRLFDMLKPFPARRAERLPGGIGIVADDLVAGLQAALVFAVVERLG
jgi:phosphatidylglycerophosphatase A